MHRRRTNKPGFCGLVRVLDGPVSLGYGEFSARRDKSMISCRSGPTMTQTEMEAYRDNLLALRNRHNGDVSHLTDEALRRTGGGAAGNLSNMPIHMADLGTDNFEQEFTLSLLQNEEQLLDEIGAALERVSQGTF